MTRLPPGWVTARLGELADTALGKMLDRGKPRGLPQVPYLRNTNIQWGHVDLSDVKTMELADGERDRFSVMEGDLLVCEGGEIGRAALWRGGDGYLAYQKAVHRIRSTEKLHLPYLRYLLELYSTNGTLLRFSTGSTIAHLPQQQLRELPIPAPAALTEQRRVVETLEGHLSRLDVAGVDLRRSTRRLKAFHDVLLRTTLVGVDVPGSRDHRLVPAAGVDDGALPPLPAAWRWLRLGEVADVVGGVTKDSKRQADPEFVEVPYVRVANVQRGHLNLDSVATIRVAPAKAEALRLQAGDVLLNEGGDRDKLARGWIWQGQIDDCIHQNHVFRARVRDGLIDPRLLSWAANTLGAPWAENNGKQTTNLASISLSKIRLMPIPVPPRDMQPGLVQQISEQLAGIDRLTKQVTSSLARSQALRKSLLDAAFSGRSTGLASDVEMVEEWAGV